MNTVSVFVQFLWKGWQFQNMNQILKFYDRIHKRKWLPSQTGKEPFPSWVSKWLHGSKSQTLIRYMMQYSSISWMNTVGKYQVGFFYHLCWSLWGIARLMVLICNTPYKLAVFRRDYGPDAIIGQTHTARAVCQRCLRAFKFLSWTVLSVFWAYSNIYLLISGVIVCSGDNLILTKPGFIIT